jgi:hypothetical protein
MNRLLPLLLFGLLTATTFAQTNSTDSSAIQTTVKNYIEGYYTGDAARMEKTMDPQYHKHLLHGTIPIREMTALQLLHKVRSEGRPTDIPETDRTEQVQVLDVSGAIASAKLITPHWTDYITLSKFTGEWKILSVVQSIEN